MHEPKRRNLRGMRDGESLPHAVHTGTPVARFAADGWTVSENLYVAGQRSKSHAHESLFIHATLAGTSLHTVVDAREEELRSAGDVGFIPIGWHHSHVIQGDGLQSLSIDILPAYMPILAESGADFTKPFCSADPSVFRLTARLHDEIRNPDPLSRILVDALIVEICVSIMRLGRRNESTSAPGWLRRIVSEIAERFREDLTLDELAAEAAVHPVHVCRAFRRCYGETLGDHIRRLRITEARRLLEFGSTPIAQIAVEVGYHDESHFSKAFKKVVGTTPGQFRQIVRVAPKR